MTLEKWVITLNNGVFKGSWGLQVDPAGPSWSRSLKIPSGKGHRLLRGVLLDGK